MYIKSEHICQINTYKMLLAVSTQKMDCWKNSEKQVCISLR